MTRTETFQFQNAEGRTLAGRLELPDGAPRAYAVFAHCFTCGKDVAAATRVSRQLAARGIAVLRFDFTGLGNSDGDFANTDFSSNVQDLVAAANALGERHAAPRLLVGHSLGGAAVLVAAHELPEVRAVATIAAPSDPAHVEHLIGCSLEGLAPDEEATVELAGRPFRMKRRFLDDVRAQGGPEHLAKLGRALLVMHAPTDELVSIDHARALYEAARHPKSFVSLDDADHLLSRRRDSAYAADVLAAWAARYLGDDEEGDRDATPAPTPEETVVVERISGLHHRVRAGRHLLEADEPASLGGTDRGPAPYAFVSAGLGACTAMTLEMYAKHKAWELAEVSVSVRHEQDTTKDADGRAQRVDRFHRVVDLRGELDDTQRERLLEIANRCPVHRTLTENEVRVTTELAPAGDSAP